MRKEIEGADIIKTRNMIFMWMRKYDRVEMGDVCSQHLISEIGT
jgi:hypothetical protein